MLVHTFFKEKGEYKVKIFLNTNAMFKDPIKSMENLIDEYEKINDCNLGDNREIKLLKIPTSYLEEKGIKIFEEKITDLNQIEEIKSSQPLVEIN